jgi:hypothetical protein
VSTLKRHFEGCAKLKERRNLPEHMAAIERMKGQVKTESKNASIKANKAWKSRKRRRRQENLNSTKPRKRARQEECSDASLPICRAYPEAPPIIPNLTDREAHKCSLSDAIEQQTEAHVDSEPPDASELVSKTIDDLAAYFTNSKYLAVQDTDVAAKTQSVLNETTNEAAMYAHSHLPTAQDLITTADAPNTYTTNGQYSATRDSTTAIRGSSFMSHTMDGSFMYIADQYPTIQNAAPNLRGSSFVNNTMDGSYMYVDDQYPTGQDATVQGFQPWPPT